MLETERVLLDDLEAGELAVEYDSRRRNASNPGMSYQRSARALPFALPSRNRIAGRQEQRH